jgi:ATP-binding cassette, subfamily B, bacterial HlyB/CyaB
LLEALDALGLETSTRPAFERFNPPAVAWLESAEATGRARPVLIVQVSEEDVRFYLPTSREPQTLPREEFNRRCEGALLSVQRRIPKPADPDALKDKPSFGFRWFVPELLKHKCLWRDVLLASLVIQLLALGLPLMTQAIIDKVVVHRTQSTLIALGIGLAIFMLFSAALTWLRQYLILHTGTRIDAVLGNAVFKHLVELPPRYFQYRPTGVIAARLHGVEQIRDFMSSAAVSLILDLPFLVICLAMMFVYSPLLTCVAMAMLSLIIVASLIVSPVFQTRLNQEFQLGARNQAFLT